MPGSTDIPSGRLTLWQTVTEPFTPSSAGLQLTIERITWVIGLSACVWSTAFILLRATQAYPLDAFEEYQLQKAARWWGGASLYGAPNDEPLPEAYPPAFFWIDAFALRCLGESFMAQRAISIAALAGIVFCGFWEMRSMSPRHVASLVFLTTLLSFHAVAGRCYEVGKPDTLLTFFLALALVAGRHRNTPETIMSSAALLLASLTKQNAVIFLLPIALWHWFDGRRQRAVVWALAMSVAIGMSYLILNILHQGHFWYWVFHWTAGHGIDFRIGLEETLRAVLLGAPVVLVILAGTVLFRPRDYWTLCLLASVGVAVLGMSKAGGRANHLLPFVFLASLWCGHWSSALWQNGRSWCVPVLILLTIAPGIPGKRDFRWIGKRAEETADWVEAVRRLEGRVAVSHHTLLARRAGAECFFSDLILEFRGLRVPTTIAHRIRDQEFDFLVLCDDPQSSTTKEWAGLVNGHYEYLGRLEFANSSQVLPDRVFEAKRRRLVAKVW